MTELDNLAFIVQALQAAFVWVNFFDLLSKYWPKCDSVWLFLCVLADKKQEIGACLWGLRGGSRIVIKIL